MIGGFGAYAATRGADQIEWQPWTSAAVTKAQSEGHPVLVDFTADWCLVCQVNSKTSVNIDRVQEKLKNINGVAMVADCTKLPMPITDGMEDFSWVLSKMSIDRSGYTTPWP